MSETNTTESSIIIVPDTSTLLPPGTTGELTPQIPRSRPVPNHGIPSLRSKRRHEGYLLSDHRASPGMPQATIPGLDPIPTVGEGQMYETAIVCCRHCQKEVILNPDRTRERGYCPKCDHYMCDSCTAVYSVDGVCRDIEKVFAKMLEDAARSQNIQEI